MFLCAFRVFFLPIQKKNRFLLRTKEVADLNQYWYSKPTIEAIVKEVGANATACAFLSTPSIFFSFDKKSELRKKSKVFDLDPRFEKDPGFVVYDFKKPENIPKELHNTFDYVVIDPPFITEEVLTAYAEAAKLLLIKSTAKKGEPPSGKLMISTLVENAKIVEKTMGGKACKFQPSIPKLVYQYNLYTNYPSSHLNDYNPEVPH